jgi:hypothetical protein
VIDFNGNILFTYERYQNIGKKMQGFSYFGLESEYKVASDLSEDKIIKEIVSSLEVNRNDIKAKQNSIKKIA